MSKSTQEDPAEPGGSLGRARGKRRKLPLWQELGVVVGTALVLALGVQTFIARAYVIPSGSMEQTLHGCDGCVDDRVIVDKMVYRWHPPQPGDVIVFHAPDADWKKGLPAGDDTLIKRVIAVGGQTVWCDGAQVFVDGKPLDEPYVYCGDRPGHQQAFGPVTVPQGRLWVMGDRRSHGPRTPHVRRIPCRQSPDSARHEPATGCATRRTPGST